MIFVVLKGASLRPLPFKKIWDKKIFFNSRPQFFKNRVFAYPMSIGRSTRITCWNEKNHTFYNLYISDF